MLKYVGVLGGVFLVLIIGLVFATNQAEANDFYLTTPNIKYDEIQNYEGTNIIYYYQSDCHYCNSIKDQIADFEEALEGINGYSMYLVDMKDSYNSVAWYDWAAHNATFGENTPATVNPDFIYDPALMDSYKDVEVTGTPTMVLVEDGEITQYAIGGDVFDILESVNDASGAGVKFDRSQYGK